MEKCFMYRDGSYYARCECHPIVSEETFANIFDQMRCLIGDDYRSQEIIHGLYGKESIDFTEFYKELGKGYVDIVPFLDCATQFLSCYQFDDRIHIPRQKWDGVLDYQYGSLLSLEDFRKHRREVETARANGSVIDMINCHGTKTLNNYMAFKRPFKNDVTDSYTEKAR